MSILIDRDIEAAIHKGEIVIKPFDRKCLGTNSYDVSLAPMLRTYAIDFEPVMRQHDDAYYGGRPIIGHQPAPLDVRKERATVDHIIGPEGFVLQPNTLYLASTVEYTESHYHVPMLNGRSSLGRLGLSVHVTAGFGDVGFSGSWVMEMFVIHPLRIYPNMKVAQLSWYAPSGKPDIPYNKKQSAKYTNRDPLPVASLMHKEHVHAKIKK